MNIKLLMIIISSFVASSGVILILLKKLNPNFGNLGSKTWLMNIGLGLVGAVVTGIASFFAADNIWAYVLLALVAIGLGTLFYYLLHARFFKFKKHNIGAQGFSELFYFISILNIMVAGFLAANYYFKQADFLFYPVVGALLFFLVPVLFAISFQNLLFIPDPTYPYWEYPIHENIDLPEEEEHDEILVLALKIIKTVPSEDSYALFRTKAPKSMVLGDLLYHFMNEYNEVQSETPIQFLNDLQQPYKWYCTKEKKGIKAARVLDPQRTIGANRLVENDVVLCDRILISYNIF